MSMGSWKILEGDKKAKAVLSGRPGSRCAFIIVRSFLQERKGAKRQTVNMRGKSGAEIQEWEEAVPNMGGGRESRFHRHWKQQWLLEHATKCTGEICLLFATSWWCHVVLSGRGVVVLPAREEEVGR